MQSVLLIVTPCDVIVLIYLSTREPSTLCSSVMTAMPVVDEMARLCCGRKTSNAFLKLIWLARQRVTKVCPRRISIGGHSHNFTGLCIKSVCWVGEKVLAGTKDGEVFEVEVQDRDNPTAVVQVSSHYSK